MLSRFPLAFRPTGLRFLSRPVPPETSAFLTVGPPPSTGGLRRGFHVPRAQDAAGLGALYAPGRRCSPRRCESSARRLLHRSGAPCTPVLHPTCGVFSHERSSRVHGCSPVWPSPCLSPPGGTRALDDGRVQPTPTRALGLLPGASPRRCQRRTSGWGRGIGHEPGTSLSSATPPTPSPRLSTPRTRPRVAPSPGKCLSRPGGRRGAADGRSIQARSKSCSCLWLMPWW